MDEARQGSIVQVVDRAIVPDKRSVPQRTLIVLGALVFGLSSALFGPSQARAWRAFRTTLLNTRSRKC